jgi:hypothetical protein
MTLIGSDMGGVLGRAESSNVWLGITVGLSKVLGELLGCCDRSVLAFVGNSVVEETTGVGASVSPTIVVGSNVSDNSGVGKKVDGLTLDWEMGIAVGSEVSASVGARVLAGGIVGNNPAYGARVGGLEGLCGTTTTPFPFPFESSCHQK